VPGQKARRAMGLRRADVGVHVAEVRETPQALVVELCEGRHENGCVLPPWCVGVLSDPHHRRRPSPPGQPRGAWIVTSPLAAAGFPELPAAKKRKRSCRGSGPAGSRCCGKRPRGALRNTTDAAAAADTAVIFRLTVAMCAPAGVGHADPQRRRPGRRSGRWGSRCCDLQFRRPLSSLPGWRPKRNSSIVGRRNRSPRRVQISLSVSNRPVVSAPLPACRRPPTDFTTSREHG